MMAGKTIEVQPIVVTGHHRDAKEVIKFGVMSPLREGDKSGELIQLHPDDPLSQACVTACERWG